MNKLFLLLGILFLVPALMFAQDEQVIQNFDAELDTSYFVLEISDNASPDTSYADWAYETSNTKFGDGALSIDYSAHNIEGWGGYSKIEHIAPDSQVFDWSGWDTVSFWYYNETPATPADRIHLRFQLYDVSDVPDTNTIATNMEFYYSFHYVLENDPGWNEIKIVLKDGRSDPDLDEWNGEAFNRTGWAGVEGNDDLDTDKIKGWAFEFSVNGSGDGDFASGKVIFDHIALKGYAGNSLVIFDGMKVPPAIESGIFTWGQSTLDVVEGAGEDPKTNALRWTQGDEWANGWTGGGYNLPATDLSKREWTHDSLKFAMKAEVGTGLIRVQFEDGQDPVAKVKTSFEPVVDDGGWHDYAFALKDFIYEEGANFDSSAVMVFQFVSEGNAVAGREILFDFLWTGNPDIDVTPSDSPKNVQVIPNTSEYYNYVVWEDVEGEEDETYNVYAGETRITDVEALGVELIAINIEEGIKEAKHLLRYPLKEKALHYFYAVTCTDKAGNVSNPGIDSTGATNTAQGVATISLNPPVDFAADGDVSEWIDANIEPLVLKPSTDKIAWGSFTDDNDFTANIYMAVDDDYLYLAYDMTDDIYSTNGGNQWYEDDAAEMFMGLYNMTTQHTGFQRGEEPDYQMQGRPDMFAITQAGGDSDPVLIPADANYAFDNYAGAYWAVEVKLSLDSLADRSGDDRFYPVNGMKIPLDFSLHDSDESGVRNGVLAYSANNNDNSWQGAQNWSYTWIGDTNKVATAIEVDGRDRIADSYKLDQNYPNPFNPSTTIEYYLPKASEVVLTVYNVLGQKVETLVNVKQTAGAQKIMFDGSKFATGVYFYKIQANDFVQVKKMLLVK